MPCDFRWWPHFSALVEPFVAAPSWKLAQQMKPMDASELPDEGLLIGKGVVVLVMEILPLLLAPVGAVNSGRIARWCANKHAEKTSCAKPTPSVNRKRLEHFLEMKRVQTCRSLVDYITFLCFFHCMFVWLKAVQFGLKSLPVFDISIVPFTVVFLLFAALFQSNVIPMSGNASVTALASAYNILLLYIQYEVVTMGMVDREVLMIIVRLFAGFFYCDHRKAAFVQIFFMIIQTPVPAWRGASTEALNVWWDVILWQINRQFIIVGPMWLLWYVVEYFVYQFSELVVSKAAVTSSLTAARAVLSSQCDAEAILHDDLTFQSPSLKTAHFLGASLEQLQSRSFLDFLSVTDKERFKQFVSFSVTQFQGPVPVSASSLSLTLELSDGRKKEIQVYLGSMPDELDTEGGPRHLMAMNQTCEDQMLESNHQVDEPLFEDTVVTAGQEAHKEIDNRRSPAEEASNLSPDSAAIEGPSRLNADTLAFHAWSHSAEPPQPQNLRTVDVTFDSDTFDLRTITLQFSPCSSRQRTKTSLKECIIPGVWDEFSHWLDSAIDRHTSPVPAPAIIPFVCPKLVTSVLAARSSELKRLRSKDGIKTHQLVLSLSDIRLRHFPRPHKGGTLSRLGRTMGRGTASCVSRSSFSDA